MFGRSKEKSAPSAKAGAKVDSETPAVELTKVGGKGRPTPKRSAAQARNARPLVPTDRKAAARAARETQREDRAKVQSALMTGDERFLPVRDRGPQKRFVRDVVDARRNVGEYFLIIAGISLLLTFVAQPLKSQTLILATTLIVYVMLAVVIIDSILLGRKVRRAVAGRFPDPERGLVSYAVTRALQMRRMRRPVAMVDRGAPPR